MRSQKAKVAVIGSGSWATALIKILHDAGCSELFWWVRSSESLNFMRSYGHNPKYLASVPVPFGVELGSDVREAVRFADWIVLALPSAFLSDAMRPLAPADLHGKYIVSAIKGIIPDGNLVPAYYLSSRYDVDLKFFLVLTGPCHAEEIALEKLSYLTVASTELPLAARFGALIKNRYVKPVLREDVIGTQYASIAKNVFAIASGICHGLGYGDNFQAVLISNALKEMKHLLQVLSPVGRNLEDSAYLGDLLVTAYSQFSRNRTFGMMIGKGYSVLSAQLEMNMIAEGYYGSLSLYTIAITFIDELPILESVHKILYKQASAQFEMHSLTDKLC